MLAIGGRSGRAVRSMAGRAAGMPESNRYTWIGNDDMTAVWEEYSSHRCGVGRFEIGPFASDSNFDKPIGPPP